MSILLSSLVFLFASASDAEPRKAQCVVRSKGSDAFQGPCLFHPGEQGSFTIEAAGGKRFPQASSISLYVVGRNVGDVRGVTKEGISSRWGQAARSRSDRACWTGADFSICVY